MRGEVLQRALVRRPVVTDDLVGEADQDRSEGGHPRVLRHLPDGGTAVPRGVFRAILERIRRLNYGPMFAPAS